VPLDLAVMDKDRNSALVALATRQRGLFSARQAEELGAGRSQLAREQASGRIRRLRQGVYAIAGTPPSRWDEMIGAALAVGPGAVISHQSAAEVHAFEIASTGQVELTVGSDVHSRPSGVVVHRTRSLDLADVVGRSGVAVTSPCRTLVDMAQRLGPVVTEKVLDEGLISKRWAVQELQACLGRARPNLGGRALLERLLAARAEEPGADSALEARSYRLLRSFRPFEAHHVVVVEGRSYCLDAAWPAKRVAAEIVGRAHRVASRSAFDRERLKLNALSAAGWRVVHIVSTMSDDAVLAAVSAALGQL